MFGWLYCSATLLLTFKNWICATTVGAHCHTLENHLESWDGWMFLRINVPSSPPPQQPARGTATTRRVEEEEEEEEEEEMEEEEEKEKEMEEEEEEEEEEGPKK